jgi:predicted DNA-binding protein (MmcQ/YjbR family)
MEKILIMVNGLSSIVNFKYMNIEDLREYCLSKKGVTEDLPFGDDTLVFRVMDKIFVLANLEGELQINLKCDPSRAIELREEYPAIIPGYHMNKRHWNTIIMDGSLSRNLVFTFIDYSYDLIVEGLPKGKKEELKTLTNH